MPTAKSQTLSLGLHVAAVAILLLATSHSIVSPPPVFRPHQVIPLAPLPRLHAKTVEQHSGGSNQTLLPARHGAPPPRARRVFIRPPVPEPKLPIQTSVDFDVENVAFDSNKQGDPFSKLTEGPLATALALESATPAAAGSVMGRTDHRASVAAPTRATKPRFLSSSIKWNRNSPRRRARRNIRE